MVLLFLLCGCAYFNTYYNANLFFDEAELLRSTSNTEFLSGNIKNAYKKVIVKTGIVINKYPKSKYVDDAYFMKGQSHFHIGEYDLAGESFNLSAQQNPDKYRFLSNYWLALIKWKTDKQQPALNDLDRLITEVEDKQLLAQIYKSQAEIYLDIDQDVQAMIVLEKAAELMKDRVNRAEIHFELAELADGLDDYDQSIANYENVIKYSFSNDQILESHLRIVQRYRELGDFQEASGQIQNMLNKPDFADIYADLNLELAKLDFSRNDNESAISRLDDIVVQFPKTEVSAEAFYILGEEHILHERDFIKAEYYFQQVAKEYGSSKYSDESSIRLKEIGHYNSSVEYLKSTSSIDTETDSLNLGQVVDTSKITEHLYNLGELEAFHFNQVDTSLLYFNKIIKEYPNSILEAKTLYTLSVIKEGLGEGIQSTELERQIIEKFPDSEYAEYLRMNNQNIEYGKSSLQRLRDAETLYDVDRGLAMQEYLKIGLDNESEAAIRALLFLAYEYETELFNPDSANKYYSLIADKFPDSKQAEFARNKLETITFSQDDSN